MAWTITRWTSPGPQSSINEYDDLLDRIKRNIKDDEVGDADYDNFVRQAHDMIWRDLMDPSSGREIPIPMIATGTETTDDQSSAALPDTFRRARAMKVGNVMARYVSPEKVGIGSDGYGETDITLDFYEWFDPPSSTNPDNWLLDTASDVYLWASCMQYVPWGHEPEVLQLWRGFYMDALNGLCRVFGSRPTGGTAVQKGYPYKAHYTIRAGRFYFGGPYRRDSVP